MNRKRNLLLSLTAALLSGLLVYGIYVLQLRQVQFQETVGSSCRCDSSLRANGLRVTYWVKQIAKASYTEDMLLSKDELNDMEVVVPLGENEPLLGWKVDKFRLLPSRTQSTFQIPRDYVLSVSNGIRAGDKVMLYLSGEAVESTRLFEEAVMVASVKSSGNVEIDDIKNPTDVSERAAIRRKCMRPGGMPMV